MFMLVYSKKNESEASCLGLPRNGDGPHSPILVGRLGEVVLGLEWSGGWVVGVSFSAEVVGVDVVGGGVGLFVGEVGDFGFV